jgi:hypothetical protein
LVLLAAGEVLADTLEQLVIVEQSVELLKLGLEAQAELGDQREKVRLVVAVTQRPSSLPEPRNPSVSHRKLELHFLAVAAHDL